MSSHPFSRVLLATRRTEFDVGAERLALQMAQKCGLPLSAVFPILSNPEFEAEAPQLAEREERKAAKRLGELQSRAEDAGVDMQIAARRGSELYREIVDEASRRHSDLIIIRRRGRQSFLSNLLLGEMVSKVVSYAPCSVLMVPRVAQMWSNGVLAAVDDSPSAEKVTKVSASIAGICKLPLTIVNVISSKEMQNHAEAVVATNVAVARGIDPELKVNGLVLHGKPYEQILTAGRQTGSDLIVTGRQGDTSVAKIYLGGTMHKVAGLAEGSVLVVHP